MGLKDKQTSLSFGLYRTPYKQCVVDRTRGSEGRRSPDDDPSPGLALFITWVQHRGVYGVSL